MIRQLVILSFDILDGEIVVVGAHYNVRDFVRDLIEGLVVINTFESFMISMCVEMETPTKPVTALFKCNNDG